MSSKNLSNLLDPISKRDILFGARKASSANMLSHGQGYAAAGHFSDAIDFLVIAQAWDELKKVQQSLVADGDVFLLLKLLRLAGARGPSEADIATCAANAESKGKIRYAIMGFEKLGQKAKVDTLRASIQNDGDIQALAEAEVFVHEHAEEIAAPDGDEA